jgi:hypothetical protein
MIFYLLEVLILSIIAFQVFREMKQEETKENIKTDQDKKGPSADEMIKMRALAKEMERQSK